ncbi:hypothetical protein ABKN59_005213 [Abortiporus biennis]
MPTFPCIYKDSNLKLPKITTNFGRFDSDIGRIGDNCSRYRWRDSHRYPPSRHTLPGRPCDAASRVKYIFDVDFMDILTVTSGESVTIVRHSDHLLL